MQSEIGSKVKIEKLALQMKSEGKVKLK